jgi:dCTP deaminase
MILTGHAIVEAINRGHIVIEPFDPKGIRTNSYDWRLGPRMLVAEGPLDAAKPPHFHEVILDKGGYLLEPGRLYLGETLERTESDRYAQFLNGDRRTGSLGIWVHISAPLGHTGHAIRWTLEISVVKPVWVYPGMRFGRIVFLSIEGVPNDYRESNGKYARSAGVEKSRLHWEMRND